MASLARIDALHKQLADQQIAPGQRIAFRSSDGIDYVVAAPGDFCNAGRRSCPSPIR